MVLGGIVGSVLLGSLAVYLVLFQQTWWAVLPGLFTFVSIVAIHDGLRDWRIATRSGRQLGETKLRGASSDTPRKPDYTS